MPNYVSRGWWRSFHTVHTVRATLCDIWSNIASYCIDSVGVLCYFHLCCCPWQPWLPTDSTCMLHFSFFLSFSFSDRMIFHGTLAAAAGVTVNSPTQWKYAGEIIVEFPLFPLVPLFCNDRNRWHASQLCVAKYGNRPNEKNKTEKHSPG